MSIVEHLLSLYQQKKPLDLNKILDNLEKVLQETRGII